LTVTGGVGIVNNLNVTGTITSATDIRSSNGDIVIDDGKRFILARNTTTKDLNSSIYCDSVSSLILESSRGGGYIKMLTNNSANSTFSGNNFMLTNNATSTNQIVVNGEFNRVGIMKDVPAYTLDVNGSINGTSLNINGTAITATASELNYVDITLIGTAEASKALVLDTNRDITNIRNLTATNLTGTLQTASQTNITSVGTLTGLTSSGIISITNTTTSTNTTSGALIVTGGVGIGGALNVFGNINGTIETASQPNITSLGTLTGLTSSGIISITNNTASTTTSTGALIVTGGVGIGGALNIFGNINGTIGTSAQPNITSVGNLTIPSQLTITNGSTPLSITNTTSNSTLVCNILNTGGDIDFGSSTNNTLNFITNGSRRISISDSTTAITNSVTISSDNSAGPLATYQRWENIPVSNIRVWLQMTNTGAFYGTTTNHPIRFMTNGVGRIFLASAGNVGINNLSPSYQLDISGSLNSTSFFLNGTQVNSTAVELNYLDLGTGPGTAEASKALVLDSSLNISGIRRMTFSGNRNVSSSIGYRNIEILNSTYTNTYTPAFGTDSTHPVSNYLGIQTFTASNINVTTTTASTLYIQGAPTTSGTAVIANPFALFIEAGASFTAGTFRIGNSTASTSSSTGALVVTGGVGITGALNVGGNSSSASISIGTTTPLSNYFITALNAAQSTSTSTYFKLGRENSNRNSADIGFLYSGSNSTSNALTFGFPTLGTVMTIQANGGVGIGTGTPQHPLDVVGTIRSTQNGTGYIQTNGTVSLATKTVGAGFLGTTSNHNLVLYTNDFDRITILSTGNVGVGTSSPSYLLDVNGTINTNGLFRSSTNGTGYSQNNGTVTTSIKTTGGGYIGTESAHSFILYTNNLDRMTILSNGNIGIGTATPSTTLDISGSLQASGAVTITNNTASTTTTTGALIVTGGIGIGGAINAGGAINFTNNTASTTTTTGALRVTGGIGVGGNINTGGYIRTTTAAAALGLQHTDSTAIFATKVNAAANGAYLGTTTNHGLTLYTNDADRLTITNGGNVGIGTTTPGVRLDVSGVIRSTASGQGLVHNNATVSLSSFLNTTDAFFGTTSTHPLKFQTSGTERMTISSTGVVSMSGNNSEMCVITSNAQECMLALNATGTSGRKYWIGSSATGGGVTSGSFFIYDSNASAARLTINSNGNVGIGTTTPGSGYKLEVAGAIYANTGTTLNYTDYGYLTRFGVAGRNTLSSGNVSYAGIFNGRIVCADEINVISDYRMKNTISDLDINYCKRFIQETNPVRYYYNDDTSQAHFGYIAQNILKAGFDDLVTIAPKPGLNEIIEDDGFVNPKDMTFVLSTTELIPILATNIKEIYNENEELKSEINELQEKNNILENTIQNILERLSQLENN
jgi:hypothetical protein